MADDQIAITVTADTSDLEAGMRRASDSIRSGFQGLGQAAQAASASCAALGASGTKNAHQGKTATEAWAKAFASLQNTFNASLTGMIIGTTTWQKAVQRVTQTALSDFINLGLKQVESWAATEAAKTWATLTGTEARSAAEENAGDASLASLALKALKAIASDAAQAFAGVFAFLAPELGPAAAGPAAASQATVLAVAESIPFAAGGMWSVPADMLAMVHRQESILPAGIAQPMRDFFAGGAAGAGGGDSYAITIQAIDTQTGAQFLLNNSGAIAQSLARELRNGNASLRGAIRT